MPERLDVVTRLVVLEIRTTVALEPGMSSDPAFRGPSNAEDHTRLDAIQEQKAAKDRRAFPAESIRHETCSKNAIELARDLVRRQRRGRWPAPAGIREPDHCGERTETRGCCDDDDPAGHAHAQRECSRITSRQTRGGSDAPRKGRDPATHHQRRISRDSPR